MSTFTFKWPKGPESVVVTGDFDNWSKLCPLVKQPDGSFESSIPLAANQEKVQFKFVVDDDKWLVSSDYEKETDKGGNVNNVLYLSNVKAASSKGSAFIPESGGLPIETNDGIVTTPVMPKDPVEPNPETEAVNQSQATAAIIKGPGIAIPKNPETVDAFKQVRNVNAKELNKKVELEEKAKEPKYVKKVVKKVKKEAPESNTVKTAPAVSKPVAKKGFLSKLKKIFD
ncbi:hypothetical protein FOA43_002275 [Brettanomyces nanus]|uniref:AMP-activated protein kinase glycogen-binding domain-containing protein n=1 Tax=Eeniella nana TaxID=13502 RepID=A0A875RUT4_EENNA|nr:uncharacterized protein FOA43_002275 [Brettanomyces nanus]QPG74937.1 hypothetical protein FOA43_002275 [Brettanomyces nanus]